MTSYLANALTSSCKNTRFILGFVMVLVLPGCAAMKTYNLQEMEGWVVDSQTREHLDGVMIVESWEALEGSWHTSSAGFLPLRESITDLQGHFQFSARGVTHVEEGHLRISDPSLLFFKPCYRIKSASNKFHPDRRFEFNRRSDWHQKTIEMEKFEGTLEQQARELERFSSVLGDFTGRGGWCIWTSIPKTLRLVRREDIRLESKGVDPKVAISAPWIMDELGKCPHFEEFFKVFKHGAK